jgi:hypothetical protein
MRFGNFVLFNSSGNDVVLLSIRIPPIRLTADSSFFYIHVPYHLLVALARFHIEWGISIYTR